MEFTCHTLIQDTTPFREIDLSRGAVLVQEREQAFPLSPAFSVILMTAPSSPTGSSAGEKKDFGASARLGPSGGTSSSLPATSAGPNATRHVFVASTPEERDDWMDEVREILQTLTYGLKK